MDRRSISAWIAVPALGLGIAQGAAACPAGPEELLGLEVAVEGAFARMDPRQFEASYEAFRASLGCLSERPTPEQAAAVHRIEALARFTRRDLDGARLELQAMVESDPRATLPAALAPKDGELARLLIEARALPPSPRVAVAVPFGLTLVVDGAVDRDRPSARSALVVWVERGEVLWSGLLAPSDPLPELPRGGALDVAVAQVTERPFGVAAVGTSVVAAGLWVGALAGRSEIRSIQQAILDNESEAAMGRSAESVERLRSRTAAVGYAAEGVTALAIGLGVVELRRTW